MTTLPPCCPNEWFGIFVFEMAHRSLSVPAQSSREEESDGDVPVMAHQVHESTEAEEVPSYLHRFREVFGRLEEQLDCRRYDATHRGIADCIVHDWLLLQ